MVKNFSVISHKWCAHTAKLASRAKNSDSKILSLMRGHLQCRDTFAWIQEGPLKRGTTVPIKRLLI